MNCRLCGAEGRPLPGRADITLYRCRVCRLVYGHPTERVSTTDMYRDSYAKPPPPAPEVRYEEWLSRAEQPAGPGRLLEIGAGSGGLVRVAVRRGWKVSATEVSETGVARLRESGADVFEGDVEHARFEDAFFDLVVSLEVLEHLERPLLHLRELRRVTRPGGRLLLSTPNYDGLSRRWLGPRWRVVDPQHLSYFTRETLSRALREVGYRTLSIRARSLDVTTWRKAREPQGVAAFDPYASAQMRDAVESRAALRGARNAVNVALGFTGLGDTLLVWAEA